LPGCQSESLTLTSDSEPDNTDGRRETVGSTPGAQFPLSVPRTRYEEPMAYTIVFFHAHPDDEAIATGGTMARAKRDGHRVILVSATRGELGQHAPDSLAPG